MSLPNLIVYAWFAIAPFLFGWLPARRAVIAGYVLAWSFLPIAVIDTPFVDVDKFVATSLGVLLGLLFLGQSRFHLWRLTWWDVPILAWTVVPVLTSVSNDLGLYDGLSASTHRFFMWGVPYLLARLYLADTKGIRELAIGVFLGGLLYVPLCLFEIRMSPRLHLDVYGYHQHAFLQTVRTIGGYRPMVFMHHGLMVGLWMTIASLVGIVLWKRRVLVKLCGVPMGWLVAAVVGTALLCQSFGALILLGLGLVAWWGLRRHGKLTVGLLVGLPLVYCAIRVDGLWAGKGLVDLTRNFSEERAASLEYRLEQEEILSERAWERPVLGWGGFNRAFPPPNGSEFRPAVSDSLWIVVFGMNGLVGLACVILAIVAPVLALAKTVPPRHWWRPEYAPAGALAIGLSLYLTDGMVNMMVNPIFMLGAGSITSIAIALQTETARTRREAATAAFAAAERARRASNGETNLPEGASPA